MIFRRIFTAGLLAAASACASVAPQSAGAPGEPTAEAGGVPPAPSFVRADFMGKDASAIDALLGEPGLVRVEGAGEFRRYALPRCALIVILYPDETGERRAAHLDAAALTSGEEKPDLDLCLGGDPAPSNAQR